MRTLSLCGAVALGAQDLVSQPPFIWDIVGSVDAPESMPPKVPDTFFRTRRYENMRTPENCSFPLDVVILQDVTDSFTDNIASMRNTQLDLIVNGIKSQHPDSKFGVISFQDKAVFPLGNRDDYCLRFDAPLSGDIETLKTAYGKLTSYGGADAPENHFGALYAALSSGTTGWSHDSGATKLVIISTDAGPHFAGDSHTYDLGIAPFSGEFDEANMQEQCLKEYYPSPTQMKDKIAESKAYVASLVYDGDWAHGWPSKSWISFNSYIGQTEDFVAPQAPDSSDFWVKLAKVIETIEDIECHSSTTSSTTTTMPTHSHTTTESSTTTPRMTDATTTHHGECQCPCESCTCCAEVVIRLQHKPDRFHLDVEN